MHLKGALHAHTTFSDGALAVEAVCETYRGLGFDFVAITDHDFLVRPDYWDCLARVRTDVLLFAGMELTVFEKGYVHVNRIRGERDELHIFNHPADLNLPLRRIIERILAVARRLPIDAVELTARGTRIPELEAAKLPFPKVATDDSHTRAGCGRAWVEMDSRRDKDAIIRAIREGDFWNCYADAGRYGS
ncbi:MAG: hypothetical protein HYV63_06355 [Candidatus Schekmanbacteria bacterium]|nr:hypothetical protein [Candidatus Schekmanbacteria bacterium]